MCIAHIFHYLNIYNHLFCCECHLSSVHKPLLFKYIFKISGHFKVHSTILAHICKLQKLVKIRQMALIFDFEIFRQRNSNKSKIFTVVDSDFMFAWFY